MDKIDARKQSTEIQKNNLDQAIRLHSVSNQCQHARGYAPKGQTPLLKTQSKRMRVNLISAKPIKSR